MKRIVVLFLVSLSLASVAAGQTSTGKKNSNNKAEQAVLQTVREWLDAFARNDLAALERIMPDDYSVTTSEGTVLNREQDLAVLKAAEGKPADVKFESATAEDLRVHVFGETAVVTGLAIFKGNYKSRAFESRERFTDIFIRRKGRWQPIISQSTRLRQQPSS